MMRNALYGLGCLTLTVLAAFSGATLRAAQDSYGGYIAQSDPRTPAEEQKCFHLPPGFAIELVASEPAIGKPINMNFDDRGRIWLTQSVEYPFPVSSGRTPRDKIKILECTHGDGVADRVTTFADGLNIPIGILPITISKRGLSPSPQGDSPLLLNGALVYSIPNIYRVSDTDGDGRADKRELLYGSFGFRDTHGMASSFTWGFDGWIYACHGYSNTSVIKGADGHTVKMQSGNTYRMKLDGSHVEQFTHGLVNPFGLCFDPLGNLYAADCETKPVTMLLRGGYYQSFGKPNDGLGFAPEMCDHKHGSTAIAGMVDYAADHFPPEYRDTVFMGNVVTNRINHDRLERHGSSYQAILQPDFLTCDDPWFRPVDLKIGPDGALYVADFYNRIIGHYEVPLTHPGRDRTRGRIWRIVYRGPDGKGKPVQPRADWNKATIPELIEDLAHPNLVVRMKATNQLVDRGGREVVAAVRAVMKPQSLAFPRMHGLWVLERLHVLDDALLEAAVKDQDRGGRVHAMRVLAERPTLSAVQHGWVLAGLKDADAFVQRAAADALGTHPSVQNMEPLLALRQQVPSDDTHLLYVVRVALRNQLLPAETWAKLPIASWSEKNLSAVADVSAGVPSAEAADFLMAHLLRRYPAGRDDLLRYIHHIARYGTEAKVTALVEFARHDRPDDAQYQAALFKAIQQGTQERGGKLQPEARQWASALARQLLASGQAHAIQTGAELAGSQHMAELQEPLTALAGKKQLPDNQREAALDALVAINTRGQIPLLDHLITDTAESMSLREHSALLLARINQPEAHAEVLKMLAVAPAPLQNVIAIGLAGSRQGADKLLEAVTAGKASARLLQERWIELQLQHYPELKNAVAKLTHGLPPADQRLQELMQRRRSNFLKAKTDPMLGAKVFEKNCAICHQMGGKGAKVGPQLDGVGVRGLDRLLEDILDPNRNVDQAFRSSTLALKNGQIVNGLVLREEGEVVVLADAQGKEVRIPKNTIEERTVSLLSPMPANLAEQIPETDFDHLLAYLLTQRPSQNGKAGSQ
jgi:putative heme-binding domain-containing protein